MTNTDRFLNVFDDFRTACMCTKTTTTPSRGMQYHINNGRYKIIGALGEKRVVINLSKATLMRAYTSRMSNDLNIYKTVRRPNSDPFIIIPSSRSSTYCWRVPVVIHDSK